MSIQKSLKYMLYTNHKDKTKETTENAVCVHMGTTYNRESLGHRGKTTKTMPIYNRILVSHKDRN